MTRPKRGRKPVLAWRSRSAAARRAAEIMGDRVADDAIGAMAAHADVRRRFDRLTRHERRHAALDLEDHQDGAPLRPDTRAGVLRDVLAALTLDHGADSLARLTGRALAYAAIAAGAADPLHDGDGFRSESDLFHDREIEWHRALDAARAEIRAAPWFSRHAVLATARVVSRACGPATPGADDLPETHLF